MWKCFTGLGLCCLMTPGLSKDIRCHAWPYFFFSTCKSPEQTSGYTNWAVRLMIAHGHFNLPEGFVWVYVLVNILTLSPPRENVSLVALKNEKEQVIKVKWVVMNMQDLWKQFSNKHIGGAKSHLIHVKLNPSLCPKISEVNLAAFIYRQFQKSLCIKLSTEHSTTCD